MNILVIGQYYQPVKGAGALRTRRFANFLSQLGHKVTVLTGFPTYPLGQLDKKYRGKLWEYEKDGKIKILRVYEYPSPAAGTWKRLLNMVSFTFFAWWAALLMPAYDAVIVTSPPFLLGLAGLAAAREKKCKFYFDVRDLWPDVTIELGLMKPGLVFNVFKKLESRFYKRADKIFLATDKIRKRLIVRGVPAEKLITFYNTADTDIFKPTKISRRELELPEKDFIVTYVGNHSRAYDLDNVLKTATILKDKRVSFVFIGEGEVKESLLAEIQKSKINNVLLLPQKDSKEIAQFLSVSDAGLISLTNTTLFQETVPAKTAEYLASGKPVIATIGGEIKEIIEKEKVGLVCAPGDPKILAQTILKLKNSKALQQSMSKNARNLALSRFSNKAALKRLKNLF